MSPSKETVLSSSLLLAKHLPAVEQKKLITELIENELYCELSDILDVVKFDPVVLSDTSKDVSNNIIKKLTQLAENVEDHQCATEDGEESQVLPYLSKIIKHFNVYVFADLNSFIVESLVSYINTNKLGLFDPHFQTLFVNKVSCMSTEPTHVTDQNNNNILTIFEFLEQIFLNFEDYVNMDLDQLLVVLTNSKNEDISSRSCKLIRWRINGMLKSIEQSPQMDTFLWSIIPYMLSSSSSNDRHIIKNALSIWLRFLLKIVSTGESTFNDINNSYDFTNFVKFKDFLVTDQYWLFIQMGLSHDLAEIRKISLSILKLTLTSFQSVFQKMVIKNTYISMDNTSEGGNLHGTIEQWKKYTTLYEIIAVDTALNQFKDATQDFLDLFALGKSCIHPSWGLIILSTGLKSSMEGVRKYSLQLMFLIEDRSVFKYKLDELFKVFMPSAMLSSNFHVSVIPGSITELECHYGETFTKFVADLIHSTKDNLVLQNNVVDCLLDVLIDFRAAYDPARVYLALGIYNALHGSKDLRLNTSHIAKLSTAVFEVDCEDKVFETMLQITALRMLSYYDTQSGNSDSWILAIATHIRKFGYEFFPYVAEDLKEFCIVNFGEPTKNTLTMSGNLNSESESAADDIGDDVVVKTLEYLFFDELNAEISPDLLVEISKISGSGKNLMKKYQKEYMVLLNDIYQGSKTINIPDIDIVIDNLQDVNWNNFQLNVVETQLLSEIFVPSKFHNSVQLYKRVLNESVQYPCLKLQDLLEYYNVIVAHSKNNKSLHSKHKDLWFQDYFKLIHTFLVSNGISGIEELADILEIMRRNLSDNGNYHSNLEIIDIFRFILDSYITTDHKYDSIVNNEIRFILNDIWEIVACARLVLNQRLLHLSFIKTFFHYQVLYRCNTNNDISGNEDLITNIQDSGLQIIEASSHRRVLLPLLSKQLLDFVQKSPDLGNQQWLMELCKSAMTVCPQTSNIYKFKDLIGTLFDRCFSTHYKYYFPQGLYFHVHGEKEIFAKTFIVGCIVSACKEFQQDLMENIFNTEINIFKADKRNNGPEEMERLIKWQVVTLTLPNADLARLDKHVRNQLIPSLMNDESSPLCRYYNEWISAYSIVKNFYGKTGNATLSYLMDLFYHDDIIKSPVWLVSCVRILYLATSYLNDLSIIKKFLTILISHCTSNKPLIRHFCNSLTLSLWPKFKDVLLENKETELSAILEKLYDSSNSTQVHGQYRFGDAKVWDLLKDLTLTNIFGGLIYKISDHDVPIYIDTATFTQKFSNLKLNTPIPIGTDEKGNWLKKRNSKLIHEEKIQSKKIVSVAPSSTNSTPLQTKSGAWNLVFDIDNKKSNSSIERSDLIVMASLVDKPPNLGGICRLCDVLGCGLLTVDDIEVKEHPQFKNVAVTADKWMPMEQVKIGEIVDFLTQKKLEGYTLVGLEQTDKSIKLDNHYQFPKKTCIVLGIEAFGIPGYILEHLDLCLEIQQFGVIRSMNIQTATAVICYAYTIQHM